MIGGIIDILGIGVDMTPMFIETCVIPVDTVVYVSAVVPPMSQIVVRCRAGLYALVPRVTKICVFRISTLFKPRNPAITTDEFVRFLNVVELGTY